MMNLQRPCLVCRRLFVPTRQVPSHCSLHIPPKKKYKDTRNRGRRPYDDTEYRRNRAKIRKMQRYCVWCGSAGTSNNKLQVDHIIPISRNGTHDLENLRILCQNCHKSRQGKAHR
tara:strand:- start:108 stop:452 length:345 start_codon:yes stop_codon:yes gene_type:complete